MMDEFKHTELLKDAVKELHDRSLDVVSSKSNNDFDDLIIARQNKNQLKIGSKVYNRSSLAAIAACLVLIVGLALPIIISSTMNDENDVASDNQDVTQTSVPAKKEESSRNEDLKKIEQDAIENDKSTVGEKPASDELKSEKPTSTEKTVTTTTAKPTTTTTIATGPPNSPNNFQVASYGNSSGDWHIDFSWTASSTPGVKYCVYKAPPNGPGVSGCYWTTSTSLRIDFVNWDTTTYDFRLFTKNPANGLVSTEKQLTFGIPAP